MTTSTKERGTDRKEASEIRAWVRDSAAAQGLPAEIEDAGVYAQLAAIIIAGRQASAAARPGNEADRAS